MSKHLLNGVHIFALKYSNPYGKQKCKNAIKKHYQQPWNDILFFLFFWSTKFVHKACNKNNIYLTSWFQIKCHFTSILWKSCKYICFIYNIPNTEINISTYKFRTNLLPDFPLHWSKMILTAFLPSALLWKINSLQLININNIVNFVNKNKTFFNL